MPRQGPEFCDDDAVFNAYTARRARADSPHDLLEKPILDELLGDLTGLRILDLGCGDAALGREALSRGCRAYHGIDGSRNMVALARQALAGTPGTVERATMKGWTYPAEAVDLMVSRLALHNVADGAAVFGRVLRALVHGGRFVFSVERTVITSSDRAR